MASLLSVLSRPISMPPPDFFLLLKAWFVSAVAFFVTMFFYICNPVLRAKHEIHQVRRAMFVLRWSTLTSIALVLPLIFLNSPAVEAPLYNPLTSFVGFGSDSVATRSDTFSTSENPSRGKLSWNFSVCRPIFGLLALVVCLVVDNHKFFRCVACSMVLFQVCADAIAAIDIGRALDLLSLKCAATPDSEDCTNGKSSESPWGESELVWLKNRDVLASALNLYSLFTVLFLGTAIGFTHNRYAYSQLHPTHDQNLNLWKELDKIGFTHAGYMLTKASKKRRQPAKKRI